MANRFKGEVEFQTQDRTWILRLNANDLLELQNDLGFAEDKEDEFLEKLGKMRGLRTIRTIVAAGLRGLQPEATDQTAGEVITELGFKRVLGLVNESLKWSMPDPEPEGEDGGKKEPSLGESTS